MALKADATGYLEIISPLDGSRYMVDPSLPKATQVAVPKFATGIPFDRSEWNLDGNPIPKVGIVLPEVSAGKHRLTITLWNGREKAAEKSVEFSVER